MKTSWIILFCFLTLHFSNADTYLSEKKAKKILVKGSTRLSNVKANSVVVDGYLAFNDLDVKGDVLVTYPIRSGSEKLKCRHLTTGKSITANHLECESAHICGAACIEHLKVSGDTTIKGDVKIKNGELNNLNLSCNEIHLQNVNVNDIIIEEPRIPSLNQSLYLKGKTVVAGTINFKSDKGVIFMDKDVVVNGEINGATINKE